MSETLTSRIDQLARRFEQSCAELIGDRTVAMLADFPNYANVGDSAIFLGELEMLRRLHRMPHTMDVFDFTDFHLGAISSPAAHDVILINGGGNFGDIYPEHQETRLTLISRYPQMRIIQLPQSIHFRSPQQVERTARCIAAHSDFHLMVRDEESLAFARAQFQCNVVLAPDAALSLRRIDRKAPPTIERMGLLRTDGERVQNDLHDAQDAHLPAEDWIREPDAAYFKMERGLKRIGQWYPAMYRTLSPATPLCCRLYTRMAHQRLDRGVRQLGKAHAVRTDRLHAFILCRLMDIEVETRDNSYGKIAAFRSTWGL